MKIKRIITLVIAMVCMCALFGCEKETIIEDQGFIHAEGGKIVDGNGNEVVLSYPEGMISWLMDHSSHYNPETDNSEIKPVFNILNIIKAPIMTVYIIFRNLVRPIFG